MLELNLLELKIAVNRVLDHIIETRGVTAVKIDKSFYWDIPFAEKFDIDEKSFDPTIGSLADEWEFAKNLLTGQSPPLALQLSQLAPIFDYLGHTLSEKFSSEGG